ncbi:MAG TPA: FAD-binding oxidoreductase [Gemmatimonadales bacterium]|nr:FAD-binding oxidoreductase [Gemmatimonadales bacterium]
MIRGAYRTDLRARAAYAEGAGIYRVLPAAVARPADIADLADLVRGAVADGSALIPRGAGSGMAGGNVGSGVIVDLTGLAERPLEIDPAGRTLRAGTQVSLAEMNAAAASHGLRIPPDPSSGGWATVGGMIGTNASGPRTLKHGSVREWVVGVELMLEDGKVVELERERPDAVAGRRPTLHGPFAEQCAALRAAVEAQAGEIGARFPKVRKNSTGYAVDRYLASGDLLDLIIGAEGTLGIVTAATWRLAPVARHRSALRLTLRHLEDLGALIPMLVAQGAATAELLDQTFLRIVRDTPAARSLGLTGDEEGVVLVEFEGSTSDDVRTLATLTSDLALRTGADSQLALSTSEMDALLKLRKSASPILAAQAGRRSMQLVEDGCVPVERLGEYVLAVRRASRERGVEVVIFGHAGDGNIHVNTMADLSRPDWQDALRGVYGEVTDAVLRLGGVPSGEHGDGRLRGPLLERVYGPALVALFRQVKRTFDPAGVFNPGIKVEASRPPVAELKFGEGAAAIPDDIAQALRTIEKEGGYARNRLELADGR